MTYFRKFIKFLRPILRNVKMVLLFNPLCTTLWKLMVLWIIFFTMPISSVGMTTKMMTKDSNNTSELHENCPVMCRCPTPETVDCSQAKLTDIPHDISQKAINLLLNGNRLSEISDECFSMCPRIQTLNLKGNEISEETISKNAFYALSNLHHLYLSQNKLQKIPKDLPNSIISLNLEGNFIHEVDDFALAQKQHLRRLYLHNNNITSESLSKKAFRRLLKLEEITLSNNFMQAIPLLPDYIERLHMENNQISRISAGIFRKKKKLIALYLQNNNLINEGLSSKSFTGLNQLEYLDLSNNELKEIPENIPKNIRRLHLEKNHLEKITHKSLAALQKLEYLLLQYNNLNSSSIDPGSFSKLRSLKTLHMFTNNLETVPSFLPPRLEYLILLSNGIKKLKRNTFAGARQIRDLNMRYNKITNSGLEKGAFRPLPRLTTIDLSGNQLTAVPSLPRSAEVVHLSDNRIVRIPHKSITRLSRLYHLVLSGNKLQTIANDIFKDSIKMKILDLSRNQLRTLPSYFPPNVEYLQLHHNQLSRIGFTTFISSPLLRVVFLQENNFVPESVDARAFHGMRFLERVDINWKPPSSNMARQVRRRRHTLKREKRRHFRLKKVRFYIGT